MRREACQPSGPPFAQMSGMSAIVFKVNRKSGDYIKAAMVPSNHTEEAHFGLLDGTILMFFLLCASGLIFLLLHG